MLKKCLILSLWAAQHGFSSQWSGEHRLMLGILESVGCVLRHPKAVDYSEAREWITDDGGDGLYTFSNICTELNVNVAHAPAIASGWHSALSPPRNARESAHRIVRARIGSRSEQIPKRPWLIVYLDRRRAVTSGAKELFRAGVRKAGLRPHRRVEVGNGYTSRKTEGIE